MDDPVEQPVARPRATRVDEKVAIAKQLIETNEKLKMVKGVMNEMLEKVQHDRSCHGRIQKVQIRLSLEAINQITPTIANNADAIAPIQNISYACSRQARKEKQQAKMLQDISNSVGRGEHFSFESSATQKLEKVVKGDRKMNPIRLLSKCKYKGDSNSKQSAFKSKNFCPVLPKPKNIAMYAPLEARNILLDMEGKARSHAIKKMISDNLIPVSKSQMYKLLKKPVDDIKMWWGDVGRNHILDDQALDARWCTLEENVGMTDTPDTVRDLPGISCHQKNKVIRESW
jgi:hypothetical protein